METRQCKVCGNHKEETEFHKSVWESPEHYKVTCRVCTRERKRPSVSIRKGYVYIITNKAWLGWCKIGLTTTTPEERLGQYQTASPFRDFEVYASKKVENVFLAESTIHSQLENDGYSRNSEWFNIEPEEAFMYLEEM